MQPKTDSGMARHALDERQVGTLVRPFHDLVKIANGLMSVNEQNQIEFRQA